MMNIEINKNEGERKSWVVGNNEWKVIDYMARHDVCGEKEAEKGWGWVKSDRGMCRRECKRL